MDLSVIKQKLNNFTQKTSGQKKEKIDYSKVYFKPQPGKYQIRIVPSKFDKNNPFKEVYFHYGFAKWPILALTNWAKKDPIVDAVSKLRKSSDRDDWKLANKLQPKMRVFVPVIVRGEEDKGVRLWEFGKEIYTQLLTLADDPDYGDYTDIVEGRDLSITVIKEKIANREVNKVSNVNIKPKITQLSDNSDLVKIWLENQPDVLSLNREYTFDELKEVFKTWADEEDNKTEEVPTVSIVEDIELTDEEVDDVPFVVETKKSNTDKFDEYFKK